ncbi:hypothetical protein LJC46_03305 [Desulfovibrio sp. OttesenSCG-928-G15]|nr:hypothetical protein [Desulfovibrio sp. OttesenSCG-928-G15]
MATQNRNIVDPGKFFVEQAVARTAEMESKMSVADNWDRVVREEPQQIFTAPQAAKILKEKSLEKASGEEESEGARVLALWKHKGLLSCQ